MNAPRARVARRPVHGLLLLDKPLGWSSNEVLQKVKWLLLAEKAGHTGTLDPLASGVLPLCFGAATKFSQLHLEADKSYHAILSLGTSTSTGDAEGEILQQRAVAVLESDLVRLKQQFSGCISQLPPMHSALKKDGKALYEYARAGVQVERTARQVQIHELDLRLFYDAQGQALIDLKVRCSKGTYIRTLGQDIGEALGCGAHLSFLRRLQSGTYTAAQCVTLDALQAMTMPERLACLLPVASLLSEQPKIYLDEPDVARFLSGLRRRGAWPDAPQVAVYASCNQALLGTAKIASGELIPKRLLNPNEIEQMTQAAQAI